MNQRKRLSRLDGHTQYQIHEHGSQSKEETTMYEGLKRLCPSKGKAFVCWCLLSFCCLAVKGTYMESKPQGNVTDTHPRVFDVLSDFQFIGSAAKGASLDSVAIKPQDLPREFEPGIQYVWLKRGYADNQQIFRVLQDRLRDEGITILDANGMTSRL